MFLNSLNFLWCCCLICNKVSQRNVASRVRVARRSGPCENACRSAALQTLDSIAFPLLKIKICRIVTSYPYVCARKCSLSVTGTFMRSVFIIEFQSTAAFLLAKLSSASTSCA
jgi:hypothetical protein